MVGQVDRLSKTKYNGMEGNQNVAYQDNLPHVTPEDFPDIVKHRDATKEEDMNFRKGMLNGKNENTTFYRETVDLTKRYQIYPLSSNATPTNSNPNVTQPSTSDDVSSSQSKPFDMKQVKQLMTDSVNMLKEKNNNNDTH